jgi:hypothetical protein
MDNKAITEKIEALPVCKDAKAAVANLLKEFGYEPPKPPATARYPKKGEVWRDIYISPPIGSLLLIRADKCEGKEATYSILANGWPDYEPTCISPGWLIGKPLMVFYAKTYEDALKRIADEGGVK